MHRLCAFSPHLHFERVAMNIGEFIVASIAESGVETVFGIPGVHTLELYRGLARSGLRHVLPRHEQGAAFAADGYARISGKPGVCFLISGPGLGNAVTALAQSYSDSVPVLAITSVCASATLGRGQGALHELPNQHALAAAVTAFSVTAYSAADAQNALQRAFVAFATGRPRPVHIQVPTDILASPANLAPAALAVTVSPPSPAERDVVEAARLLQTALRPVIIVGGGASQAGEAIRMIAEAAGASVITTVAAKGVLPDEHPAHLGATLSCAAVLDLVRGADVVLAAGTELAETESWVPIIAMTGRLIRIDIDPAKFADRYRPHVAILADARASLEAIASHLSDERARPRPMLRHADLRARAVASLNGKATRHGRVLAALRRALPGPGAVFSDMTQVAYTGNVVFPVPAPRSWFHPSGFGTLGFALPAAIGGKIAAPERPVVALVGDYGFQFTAPELATAVDERLPLPIVVWNNDALGQIADDMVAHGIEMVGVKARSPDLVRLAEAYGAAGVRAVDVPALEDAIRTAFERDGPTLIDVRESDFV